MVENIVIPNIEQELTKLKEEGLKKGEIKACLFTLVIYSDSKLRHDYLNQLALAIKNTFPCRVISIDCDNDTNNPFLNVTTDQEVFNKESTIIACDRIDIQFSSEYKERVSYLVVPHLVPDLPVYLLWPEAPDAEDSILSKLIPFATKIIFDSDRSNNIGEFAKKMLSNKLLNDVAVTDMNWASLASWRDILFQVFDSYEKIERISKSTEIKIKYNSYQTSEYLHTERRAVYLQAWLSAQLKWDFMKATHSQSEYRIFYKTPHNHEVSVVVSGSSIKDDLIPGSIVSFEVFGDNQLLCFLQREGHSSLIKAHISEIDVCKIPFTLPLRHYRKGFPFMQEMLFGVCSKHYWNMLNMLQHLKF